MVTVGERGSEDLKPAASARDGGGGGSEWRRAVQAFALGAGLLVSVLALDALFHATSSCKCCIIAGVVQLLFGGVVVMLECPWMPSVFPSTLLTLVHRGWLYLTFSLTLRLGFVWTGCSSGAISLGAALLNMSSVVYIVLWLWSRRERARKV